METPQIKPSATGLVRLKPRSGQPAATGAMSAGLIVQTIEAFACPQCGASQERRDAVPLTTVRCTACDAPILVPKRLGCFRLVARIGAGEMGEVFRATDEVLHRDVAIKVIRAPYASDEASRARLQEEARAAAKVNHPNMAQVYALGMDGPHPYIVMELVCGEDLEARLAREGRIAEEDALRVGLDVAAGVAMLHRSGMAHGDIKPSNIILNKDGVTKLVDFGLAGVRRQGPDGSILGTPYYIAPELLQGAADNPQSDIYSLGATLYHVLSGRTPFDGATPSEVAKARLHRLPASLAVHAPHVTEATRQLVAWMLAREPAARPANCDAVAAGIRQALAACRANQSPLVPGHAAAAGYGVAGPPPAPHAGRDSAAASPSVARAWDNPASGRRAAVRTGDSGVLRAGTRGGARSGREAGGRRVAALLVGLASVGAILMILGPLWSSGRTAKLRPAAGFAAGRMESDGTNQMQRAAAPWANVLRSQWCSTSLGVSSSCGSSLWSADRLVMQSEGEISSNGCDACRYVYARVGPVFTLAVRVKEIACTSPQSRTGILARSDDSDAPAAVFFGFQGDGSLLLLHRDGDEKEARIVRAEPVAPQGRQPCALRLERRDDGYGAFVSNDGVTWKPFGVCKASVADQGLVGLMVSSRVRGALAMAVFDNPQLSVPQATEPAHGSN